MCPIDKSGLQLTQTRRGMRQKCVYSNTISSKKTIYKYRLSSYYWLFEIRTLWTNNIFVPNNSVPKTFETDMITVSKWTRIWLVYSQFKIRVSKTSKSPVLQITITPCFAWYSVLSIQTTFAEKDNENHAGIRVLNSPTKVQKIFKTKRGEWSLITDSSRKVLLNAENISRGSMQHLKIKYVKNHKYVNL